MTSQVEQREGTLSGDIWLLGRQMVKPFIFIKLVILTVVTSPEKNALKRKFNFRR